MTGRDTTTAAELVTIDPRTDDRWRRLLRHTRTDVFHSPAWMSVLADTYDLEPRARLLLDDRRDPIAGLPYVDLRDFLGPRRSTMPFSDFCDPVVAGEDQWALLTDGMDDDTPWTIRCLRSEAPAGDGRFEEVGSAHWHRIDTARPVDEMWDSLHPAARRAIRKAQKSNVEVVVASEAEHLRHFYELHRGVRRHKYGLLAQPFSFFENIWTRFMDQDRGILLLSMVEGAPAGGILFLEWGDTLYYKFNASHPDHLDRRPNDLALWEGMQHAHARNLHWVDMGASDVDQPGLVSYKEKYATDRGTIRTFRSPTGWSPSDETRLAKRTLGDVTGLFVDRGVPDHVVDQAGALLYRFFG